VHAPEPEPPADPTPPGTGAPVPQHPINERVGALVEVLLCSGLPTQLVIGQLLAIAGFPPFTADGTPQAGPLFALALIDSAVMVALIAALLRAQGERLGALLVGRRPIGREVLLGILIVPLLFIGVGAIVLLIRRVLPSLHNVPANPFERFMRTPREAGMFAVIAIIAGGLREEVQRAFLLQRFSRYLGGPIVGLIVVSVGFGAGHYLQGWDAAIATGLLGLTWGILFLRRGSAVLPIVSHAGYNAAQVVQALAVRSLVP